MLEMIANIEDDVLAAEKRKRGSASASGTDVGRARKQQVVSGPTRPLILPKSPVAPPPPPPPPPSPLPPPSAPIPPPTPTVAPMAGPSRPFLRSQSRRKTNDHPITNIPATQNKPAATPPESLPTRENVKTKAKRVKRPFQPIRLMKGHNQFDFIKSFRNAPVAVITWGELINLAPLVKRDVAKALTREQLLPRKKKVRISDQVEEIDAIEIRRALPEGLSPVINFYTFGSVCDANSSDSDRIHSLGKILIDGGSVMNIMPLYLAQKFRLNLTPTTGLAIRTATAQITRIDWQCSLDITIAGVTATATVYCIPDPSRPSYTLLLGCRWLAQCKAVGHYETDTYIIRDSEDNSFLVPVHGSPAPDIASVIFSQSFIELYGQYKSTIDCSSWKSSTSV